MSPMFIPGPVDVDPKVLAGTGTADVASPQ
jgi:hypothetical protein